MVQQVKHPDAAEANLGKPGELLSLDVVSYAAGIASGNENGESSELRVSETSWDESRPHTLAELSPIETLREIEAWIAAQDARTRTNHRVLVDLQAARANAEARADNLALELEVTQQALHTALCRANDAKRTDLAATVDKLQAELAERDAAFVQLKAERTAQSAAFEELVASRSREQQSSAARQEEVRAAAETLATEIQALEERYRRSSESVAAHAARVAKLEALAIDLGQALQAQTEATKRANTSTETRERELADEHSRASGLEAQLQAAMRHATDLSAAARSSETELKVHVEQLAASRDRLANFEREATYQSEWLANLQVELAHAEVLAEQAEASRRPVENELGRVRTELRRETERANALEATQQELALELGGVRTALERETERAHALEATQQELALELGGVRTALERETERAHALETTQRQLVLELGRVRTELQRETERANGLQATQRQLALELEGTRGILDEREFQLRRLERDANTSAQELSRIKVGIERGSSNPLTETLEFPDDGATLVPLDGDAPAVSLGRYTTIGRARENDLCLKDSSVSRRHAVLTIEPNGAFIEDLRSVNGVTVNGERIRHARVTDGDVIELGVKRFRFASSAAGRNPADSCGTDGQAYATVKKGR